MNLFMTAEAVLFIQNGCRRNAQNPLEAILGILNTAMQSDNAPSPSLKLLYLLVYFRQW